MMNNHINKGGVLINSLLVGLVGVTFVLGFFGFGNNISTYYNVRIAKTKAFYNAETGMARKAYEFG